MTQATPLVSCIIAVCNGQAYLQQAIDSLLAQDYPAVEIVVVNDGSTDGTAAVIDRFTGRIVAFHQENGGVSIARNRGVAISTGQLLCFLDADDWLDPRKIAMQAAAFAADPGLDFCDCHTDYFWSPELAPDNLHADPRYADPFWRRTLAGHISTWLFRRELWHRAGTFSPAMRFAEDIDWLSRARDLSLRSRTLSDVLTHRRLHPHNVTARDRPRQGADLADMLRAHLERRRAGRTAAS